MMAHQQQLPRRPRARRGFVLSVVLWMMVILLILVLSLAYDTQLSSSGTTNNDQQARAYYAAMSGVERLAAALDEASADTETLYTAPGQPWERIDSDEEPIAPEAAMYQYRVIAEDNCARVDLNEVDEAGLQTLTDLTPEQVASIVDYNGGAATGATTPATGAGTAATGATGTPTAFRSVDDLLLLPGFTAGELYGAASWQERLSPTERFRQEWTQLAAGGTTTPDAATAQPLADRFGVGARARRIDSMGQPRLELSTVTQEELQTRLEAIAEKLQVTQDQAPSDSGGRRRGGGGGSPVTAGLRIIRNRNVRNWSQVWGAVQNNRSAVRLLADVLTLPNDDPNAPAIADDGGGGGGGRPGGGGGRPGGGGGRPGGGGGGRPGG
ncbi:MAG TPA: hypothetical protein VK689_12275, partial [Armatimonadota bacterium]|nr:hypothetical protein [Armatimonadota bacterium]